MNQLLVINAGSSSLKFALFDVQLTELARGQVERIGHAARFLARVGGHAVERQLEAGANHAQALDTLLHWLQCELGPLNLIASAHRVVHGGLNFTAPVILDETRLTELEKLNSLAPLHQPWNLAMAKLLLTRYPKILHAASFDTAFHSQWNDSARRFAIPRALHDTGIRRYGFHGLSYQWLSCRIAEYTPKAQRIVLAHLGSGASVCAVRDGKSIDCSLGFSALDGLPMATRCGALDPGVIFHLMREHGYELDQLETMLYRDSGLKGVSGLSGDIRDLLASEWTAAHEAIDLFVHHCVKQIGAMVAVLGGIDAVVFSGGIGEHAALIRARIVEHLAFLGVRLKMSANKMNAACISSHDSLPVYVISTNEEWVIANDCLHLLQRKNECADAQ